MAKSADAIKYAEETLGVHSVSEQARAARERLDSILTELSKKRDLLREKEWALQDQEMTIASDEQGKHPDMSVSGMKEHLKIALQNNDIVREIREQIVRIKSDVEGLDYDKAIAEYDIKIAIARMNELAGYFHYLAIIKDVANRRNS